jgi:hypothetical protein
MDGPGEWANDGLQCCGVSFLGRHADEDAQILETGVVLLPGTPPIIGAQELTTERPRKDVTGLQGVDGHSP